MLSKVKTMALQGIEGFCIDVQADISAGIPSWEIVGLPDISIKEAKERVKVAIRNSGYEILSRKIIINLAPANMRKEGSTFDLSIAVAVLIAEGIIYNDILENIIFLGELSLDGSLNPIKGVLPMCIEAKKIGMNTVVLPEENAKEAAIIKGLKVIPIKNLNQIIKYLNKEIYIREATLDIDEYIKNNMQVLKNEMDFSDVKGQENIKRALEVAVSGGHNCILIGSPGSGKTMMAKRIPTILPDLTFEESLEISKIHSIAGNLKNTPLITSRPFRNPHHTTTGISLVGGGKSPKFGEVSLAHLGVLFLDELPEFKRNSLEVLRGPLEDKKITISRINSTFTYPCNFMLVASMNPCPCGYYGIEGRCKCTQQMISNYVGKVSGPLMDRIDIQVEVNSVKYEEFNCNNKSETSQKIRERVNCARKIQNERYKNEGIYSNSELTPKLIEKYCKLDENCKLILKSAFEKLKLSTRAYNRILKVARTIADLDRSEEIRQKHLLEAIQYRTLDKKYGNGR